MSPARLAAVVAATPLTSGEHALELGVGKGAFLVTLLAHWSGSTAEGFDRNPWFLADAR